MTSSFTMNSFLGKQILALVRQGNYAHAGEEEAIELAMAGLPKDPERTLLDAGCGRGGTAAYMQEHGWGHVTGIDIEPRSIENARKDHPGIRFETCDIAEVAGLFDLRFDAVTMFNVLYALADHKTALEALAKVACPGAVLMIFDYVDPSDYRRHEVREGDGAFLPNPIREDRIAPDLLDAGWSLLEKRDISDAYVDWYEQLVAKISSRRAEIEALAGSDGYESVLERYSGLLDVLRAGHLAGYVVYAERNE
ncbi:class I SAM-dependent methyltransferase [Hoeflea sp. TYP-13]|uniref:class I SAM-dependent methyltransferase n=1 Tax=Hoeflea sp. TYP-13 TaxID=3230023 RepID=UPI0034C5C4AE